MAAASDSEDQNFWPGYVDTLVNMVMFLILLIVVLAMAVMFFSIKARNDALKSDLKLQEPSKSEYQKVYPGITDEIPKNPTMEDMRKLVDRLREKLYQSEQRYKPSGLNPTLKADDNKTGKSDKINENKQGKSETVENATNSAGTLPAGVQDFALRPSTLIIRFRPGALDMTDAEAKRMADVFVKHFDYSVGNAQNFMLTVDAAEGLSESNRMAFYRVAAVRNRLMGVVGVSPARIGQKIVAVPVSAMNGTEALEVRITKVD